MEVAAAPNFLPPQIKVMMLGTRSHCWGQERAARGGTPSSRSACSLPAGKTPAPVGRAY